MTGVRVTVVVGTDHHPFTRLVEWADERQLRRPDDRVTVQYGYSAAPAVAEGVSLLPPDSLHDLIASSDIVVTHGGPATVMGARTAGHLPLVLPRDPALGEHVDQHQLRFASWAARKDLVRLVADLGQLDGELARLGATGTRTTAGPGHSVRDSVSRLVSLLDALDQSSSRVTAPDSVPLVVVTGPDAMECRRVFAMLGRAPGAVPVNEVGAGLTAELRGSPLVRRSTEARRRLLELTAATGATVRTARDRAGGDGVAVACGPPRGAVALALDPRLDVRVVWVDEPRGLRVRPAAVHTLRRRRVPLAVLRPGADPNETDRVWQQLAGRRTSPRPTGS